jgi:hypothetical protein
MVNSLSTIVLLLATPLQLGVALILAIPYALKIKRITSGNNRYPHLEISELSDSITFYENYCDENHLKLISLKQQRLDLIEELVLSKHLDIKDLYLYPFYNHSS